jgi:hypothetical protein
VREAEGGDAVKTVVKIKKTKKSGVRSRRAALIGKALLPDLGAAFGRAIGIAISEMNEKEMGDLLVWLRPKLMGLAKEAGISLSLPDMQPVVDELAKQRAKRARSAPHLRPVH